jgi:predicted PurR-regulated permease PerM
MEKRIYEISWMSLWRVLFFVAFVSVLYLGLRVLLGLFLAVVISSGLEFLVNFFERRKVPRSLTVILIFLLAALLVILVVYALIPRILVEVATAFSSIAQVTSPTGWGSLITIRASESLNSVITQISSRFFAGTSSPFGAFGEIIGDFALAASVIVSAFYLSLSRDGVERFICAVMPFDYQENVLRLYGRSIKRIGRWFRTQILLSIIMGILVLIALLVLGVKYAFLIAILTALLEIVPYVGPIIAGSVAVLAGLITSPAVALSTFIVFLVIHQIENHLLVPLLIGRNIGLHPVIVIVALLIGIEVGGFLGVLIAVPAAVVVQEIAEGWAAGRPPDEMVSLV